MKSCRAQGVPHLLTKVRRDKVAPYGEGRGKGRIGPSPASRYGDISLSLNVNHPFAAPGVNMNVVNRRGPDLFPVMSLVKEWFTRREREMRRGPRLDGMSFHKALKIRYLLSLTNWPLN